MRLQEGLLCLPAQSQEHEGDTTRPAVTQGELDRSVEEHQASSRTGGGPPQSYKISSSSVHVSDQTVRNRLHEVVMRA